MMTIVLENRKIQTNMYQTRGVAVAIEECIVFAGEIMSAMQKYLKGDWGDTCSEDCQANTDALESGARLFAVYKTSKGKVYIITEVDRTITTILFASEY
ncbi:MAG: hypothetical protein FWE03_00285 [Firmicutes bacterium]|nr:hypothetical protein [Bacillota bacterium]